MECPFSNDVERMKKEIESLTRERDSWKQMHVSNMKVRDETMEIYCGYEATMESLGLEEFSGTFDEHIKRFFEIVRELKHDS